MEAVEHLGVVGDLHHPHHRVDLLARAKPGDTLAVPALEGLPQRVTGVDAEPQAAGDVPGCLAVAQHGTGHPAGPASKEPADHRQPPHRP